MIVALGNFFLVLIITYFAVGSAKYLVSPNSVGYFEAIIGEFWASVEDGGAMPEASENQSDYAILLLKILDIGRAVVVTMVLMNIITTMLTDSYSKVKDRAEVWIAITFEAFTTEGPQLFFLSCCVFPAFNFDRQRGVKNKSS